MDPSIFYEDINNFDNEIRNLIAKIKSVDEELELGSEDEYLLLQLREAYTRQLKAYETRIKVRLNVLLQPIRKR